MKRNISIILAILAVIFGLFFFINKKTNEPKYKTEDVQKGEIIESVTASGTVNPVNTVNIGTQVSGTIKELYVDYNSPVKKGQLLAQIDTALFQAQVDQAQANVGSASANYQKIKSILENDKKTYYRNKVLSDRNFLAKSDFDLAEANYKSDVAQLNAAKAQIAQTQAQLRSAKTNLNYTRIVSSVDGIVISRSVDVGQTVAASFQTPTLFLVAQDLTNMQIETTVSEADIGKVKEGQKVTYTLDGYPNMIFNGTVKQIRLESTSVQNVVTYDVIIDVQNEDLKLKPGMTANVSIITNKKENVLKVPNSALRFVPKTKDEEVKRYKNQGIWVLEKHKPVRIDVKTGISDGEFTEITEGKLSEGMKIIIEKIASKDDQKETKMRMHP